MQSLASWKQQQRYREVLAVCLPLVIGMSATTVMEFTDRVFLANYSMEAIAAATPAGISAFLFMAFFGGIASYCGVFIAQYHGAGQHGKVGSVLWQGLYFCLVSEVVLAGFAVCCTNPLFDLVGHAPEVRALEKTYFRILLHGAVLHVTMQTLFAFFSGRGLTRPVMVISIAVTLINIPLDYALIYGIGFMPEMGIAGAGIATVTSTGIAVLILVVLVFTRKHNQGFKVLENTGFDGRLFLRLLRFGLPGSIQFTLDIFAFTLFILLVGRLGTAALAATNIAVSINAIAFMPSMGVSQGISVLVGQALGRGLPHQATRATWSAIHLLLLYILMVALIFLFAPGLPLSLFVPAGAQASMYAPVLALGTDLLRIVTCYLFFDALYMVFSGVLRGAGDTRFMMGSVGICSTFCFILPLIVGTELFGLGIYFAWGCVVLFVVSLFAVAFYRYRSGRWKSMLVIEKESPVH